MPIPSICWLAALVALLALEAATVGLVSLWFAVGSLCALLTSFFVSNIWVQFAVFLAVSFLCLVIIRPLARKYADPRREGDGLLVTLTAECVEEIGRTVPIYTDPTEESGG